MSDPLTPAVGVKLRSVMETETGVLMKRDTAAILATAALQAIEAAGYRVVPVEATEGMVGDGVEAARAAMGDCASGIEALNWSGVATVWSAMLSAAPRVGEGV